MGHANILITVDIYGHLVSGGNRAAVDRLDSDASVRMPDASEASRMVAAAGAKSFVFSGDPDFRQLEPDVELVAPSRAPPACSLGSSP
jgi:hypothetical protein